MRAALVRRERVYLVDDHGARGLEHCAAGLRTKQDVERLRRRDDDVRRQLAHAVALARRRIAGTYPGADLDVRQVLRTQSRADAGKRRFEVAVDVVRQRLQGRDVDDLGLVLEAAIEPLSHQRINRRQKGCQRLARTRGCRDQHVPAGPWIAGHAWACAAVGAVKL
jgi:hypothetical protein